MCNKIESSCWAELLHLVIAFTQRVISLVRESHIFTITNISSSAPLLVTQLSSRVFRLPLCRHKQTGRKRRGGCRQDVTSPGGEEKNLTHVR